MDKFFAILSHTTFSQNLLNAPLGEVSHSLKFQKLLSSTCHTSLYDIYELCQDQLEWFYSLAHLNMALFEEESEPLSALEQPAFKKLEELFSFVIDAHSHVLILSWAQTLSGLLGLNFLKKKNCVAKFYLFHENEKVPLKLYQPFDLLVAESPLALFKAANIGIDPSQLLYLPHQIPFSSNEHTSQRPFYKQKLLEKWEKNDSLPLIGMFCRFQYRKNVEYALKVLQRLYDEGASFVFYLKGTFDSSLEGEEAKYTAWLKEYLLTFKEAPWLIWDQKPEPFDEIVKHYAAVDFALQLSGAESASNTIVEEMAVGTPVLVLQCSTNPSLFGDGVDYVKTAGLAPGALPFYIPDEEDLYRKIKECLEKNRFLSDLSKKAIHLSRSRFNHEESVKRFHLLMDLQSAQARKKREELFYADLKEYGFER